MGYNPNFKINPEQLQLIEDALRAEIGRLSTIDPDYLERNCSKQESAKKIRELLGHLHNQKRWYKPKSPVPLG